MQVLDLVLVGHSHGGLMAHDVAQRLESTGFAVRGIMALDTLNVPHWTGDAEMEPKALLKNRAPYHWQLLALEVNMMAMRTAAPRMQSGLGFFVGFFLGFSGCGWLCRKMAQVPRGAASPAEFDGQG